MIKIKKKTIVFTILLLVCLLVVGYFASIEFKKYRYPKRYEEFVTKYAEEYNVPKELVFAVIFAESSFDEDAKSPAGAIGLMQLMPDTYDWLSRIIDESYVEGDIYKPENNIKYGVAYLSYLYNKFGNWDTAVAGYNAGHGRVAQWLSDTRYTDDGILLKEIPYEETANYVLKVNRVKEIYRELYFEG